MVVKKEMAFKKRMLIFMPIAVVLLAGIIVANAALAFLDEMITTFFSGYEYDYSRLDMKAGDDLAQEIEAEGIVLLKNGADPEGAGVLPLSVAPMPEAENETLMDAAWDKTPVVVMGWGATDAGWVMGGSGSGSSTERGGSGMNPLLDGLDKGGFDVYDPLVVMMEDYTDARGGESLHSVWPFFFLYEPPIASYQAHMEGARNHSDTAIVAISRLGGEGSDMPFVQRQWNGSGNRYSSWSANPPQGSDGYTYSGSGIANSTVDTARTYLDISVSEQAVLDLAIENFENVIVLINACNAMNLSFLEVDGVDAALSVGATGQSGSLAVADVLRGKKTVREAVRVVNEETGLEEDLVERDENGNPVIDPQTKKEVKVYNRREYAFSPSGRTADTYVRDFKADPTYVNAGKEGVTNYTSGSGGGQYVDYAENIYIGYYYYETAAQLARENKYDFDYDAIVQYPFGYGQSYTRFEWTVDEVLPAPGQALKKDDIITVRMHIKNIGNVPGKEVVQLYFTAPYYDGGIEKPHVKLCAFEKTQLLQPDEEQPVTLTFKAADMASYDEKLDPNGGYVLEQGSYQVKLQADAHRLKTVISGSGAAGYTNTIHYTVDSDILYNTDQEVTKTYKNDQGETTTVTKTYKAAQNRFSGDSAYAGVAIDGSNSGADITYLTRRDFAGTFPSVKKPSRAKANMPGFSDGYGKDAVMENAPVYQQGVDYGDDALLLYEATDEDKKWEISKPNHNLMMRLGADYEDELWDQLLNQIPVTGVTTGAPGSGSGGSLETLIGRGGWKTSHVDAIGKPWGLDLDGPSGLNSNTQQSNVEQSTQWTGFPVSVVLAQTWNEDLSYIFGLAVGEEAKVTGISGWYAPAMNMHRSPFMGRNFEYYSEDPFLSGRMGAESTRGALTNGTYAYIKHFAGNDCETSRKGLYTWMTEQTWRENILRPFEIAVKDGDANAVMTAYSRVGSVWAGGNKALLTDVLRGEWGFIPARLSPTITVAETAVI